MKRGHFSGNDNSWKGCLYIFLSLCTLLVAGGCGVEGKEESELGEDLILVSAPAIVEHGEISVSEDGETIYVYGPVDVYELSDSRTEKAKKIVFTRDAKILYEENDGSIAYIPCLHDAPMVEEIEVEKGNSTLYEVDDMLVKRKGADEDTDNEMIVFCAPGKKGEVRIPEGIQSIHFCAFLGCSGVTSVFLPESLEEIGDAAFGDMESCVSFQADEANTSYFSKEGVLYGRGRKSSTGYFSVAAYPAGKPDQIYGYDPALGYIGEIKAGAFMGASNLREVHLPSKVKMINSGAFLGCKNLEKAIVTGKKKISVEGNAFDNCPRLKEWVRDKDFD